MRGSFCCLVEGWDLIHVTLFLPLILAPAWPRARWEGTPWSLSLSVPSHPETEGSLLGQMSLSPSKKEKKDRLLSGFAIFLFVPTNYEVNTLSESTWPRHKTVAATHQGRPRIEHTPIMMPTHSMSKWYPQLKQIYFQSISLDQNIFFSGSMLLGSVSAVHS